VTNHVDEALALIAKSEPAMRGRSDRMLEAAQVHATLAVEAAVRDLIEKIRPSGLIGPDGERIVMTTFVRRNGLEMDE
jgi:hypothetical protein